MTREILAECKNQGKGSTEAPLSEHPMWPFLVRLWNGLCTLEFSLKPTPSVHKRFGKLMVSMECDSLISASFTQETRS